MAEPGTKFVRVRGKVVPIKGDRKSGAPKKKSKGGKAWKPGGSSYNKSIGQGARQERKREGKAKLFAGTLALGATLMIPGVRADIGKVGKFVGRMAKRGKNALRGTGA